MGSFRLNIRKKCLVVSAVALTAMLILPVGADACLVSVSVKATDGIQFFDQTFTGETVVAADGRFECVLVDQEIATFDGGAITSLKLTMREDPEVGMEFGVRNGDSTTKTYSLSHGAITFAPMANPTAYASAGVTLTDRSPNSGAEIENISTYVGTNQAIYNGSSVFADLVGGFSILSGTETHSGEYGNESGMITINDTLTSIESVFNFTLSAGDSASGTSTFVVVPEPVTMALLGFGGLLLLKRKKA